MVTCGQRPDVPFTAAASVLVSGVPPAAQSARFTACLPRPVRRRAGRPWPSCRQPDGHGGDAEAARVGRQGLAGHAVPPVGEPLRQPGRGLSPRQAGVARRTPRRRRPGRRARRRRPGRARRRTACPRPRAAAGHGSRPARRRACRGRSMRTTCGTARRRQVADAGVDARPERRRPDPVLVRRRAEHHVVLGLAHHLEAEPAGHVAATRRSAAMALSGRCVARISTIAERRADLDDELRVRPAALPYFGWLNRFCASSIDADERPQLQRPPGGDLAGYPLVRAQLPRQCPEPLGAAADLRAQQPQRLGGVADRLVIDAGHEPVARPAPAGPGHRSP